MLAALIIVFREVLEAGLILGIVLAATQGVPGRMRWIGLGLMAGVGGALALAAVADTLSDAMAGSGQELFNAGVLLVAVSMLAWHTIWISGHGGRTLAAEMRGFGRAVAHGHRPLSALTVVVGTAVLREGAEVVLFLSGIAAGSEEGDGALILGGICGLMLGFGAAGVLYAGLIRLPTRHLFYAINLLLTLLAAGMAAQAVAFLSQAGIATIGAEVLWDTSGVLRDNSVIGRTLHVLVGYTDRPTLLQVIVYCLTAAAILIGAHHARLSHREVPV